jgi:hypothetical protein
MSATVGKSLMSATARTAKCMIGWMRNVRPSHPHPPSLIFLLFFSFFD